MEENTHDVVVLTDVGRPVARVLVRSLTHGTVVHHGVRGVATRTGPLLGVRIGVAERDASVAGAPGGAGAPSALLTLEPLRKALGGGITLIDAGVGINCALGLGRRLLLAAPIGREAAAETHVALGCLRG